jgi:hypothetical protein
VKRERGSDAIDAGSSSRVRDLSRHWIVFFGYRLPTRHSTGYTYRPQRVSDTYVRIYQMPCSDLFQTRLTSYSDTSSSTLHSLVCTGNRIADPDEEKLTSSVQPGCHASSASPEHPPSASRCHGKVLAAGTPGSNAAGRRPLTSIESAPSGRSCSATGTRSPRRRQSTVGGSARG